MARPGGGGAWVHPQSHGPLSPHKVCFQWPQTLCLRNEVGPVPHPRLGPDKNQPPGDWQGASCPLTCGFYTTEEVSASRRALCECGDHRKGQGECETRVTGRAPEAQPAAGGEGRQAGRRRPSPGGPVRRSGVGEHPDLVPAGKREKARNTSAWPGHSVPGRAWERQAAGQAWELGSQTRRAKPAPRT